jgi:plastocyanin
VNQADRARWRWRLAPTITALVLLGVSALPSQSEVHPRRLHVVEIRGMAFQPAVLKLERGDTVVWINRDIVPHTATVEGKRPWSTGNLLQDQSGQYVARRAGEVSYFCELHPVMKGKLITQ